MISSKELIEASKEYNTIAELWKNVSDLFIKIGETEDIKYVNQASELLIELSEREKTVMERLKIAST